MKSVKMFGKSIPILAIVAIVMTAGMGGAVLVDYLSNTVKADITVVSPMVVGVSLGRPSWATTQCWRPGTGLVDSFPESDISDIHDWAWSDWEMTETSLSIPDIRGGETVTIYTMSANKANAEITGHEEIIISNPLKITSDDFENITSRFDSIYGDLGYGTLHIDVGGTTTDCYNIDDYHIELWKSDDTSTWGAGETDVAMWNITFKANASGTYTITYRIVPA